MTETVKTKHFNSRALLWTLLMISFVQMPQFAVTPAIDLIATEVFPERTLQSVQAAMSLISFISIGAGVISALLVRFGLSSKKFMTVLGVMFFAATGVTALFLNTQFWHFGLLNVLLGMGMGVCIPNTQSIMFDNFDEQKRQFITGIQSAFLNGGGIALSIIGGLLTTIVWFGGYLATLLAVPAVIAAIIFIPRDERIKIGDGTVRTKLPTGVYFNAFLIFTFAIVHNVSAMNISTHIANGNIGDAATAGIATAMMMGGGVITGLLFPKISPVLKDYMFPTAFCLLFVSFSIFNLFPTSLFMTMVGMFISGITISVFMPRCIFNVSNMTDPSNSSAATVFIACVAPGSGGFLSPIIMTNLTYALAGDSTRFRYQFTAFVCLAIAVALLIHVMRKSKREKEATA